MAQSSLGDRKIIDLQKDDFGLGNTGQSEPIGRKGSGNRARWDFEGDGQPRSGNRNGGASRGRCPVSDRPLTALVPKINLGLTIDSHPTFWFYIPDDFASVSEAGFMLLDDENNPVIDELIIVEPSETLGLVSVSLPATAKPLELDREYRWFFALHCEGGSPSHNPSVDGWIQRVEPNETLADKSDETLAEESNETLAHALDRTPDDEHYLVYANYGIWYNALTELAKQYRAEVGNPNVEADWFDLLHSVGLEDISQIPE